jgi:type I restriction enzyme S subunit
MKESGVECIDKLPAHWTILPLKRWVQCKITDGPHETPEFIDDGVQFVSAEAVVNGCIDFERRRGFISHQLHHQYSCKCKPEKNDILLCKSGATTGKLAFIDVNFEFSIWSPLALVRADNTRREPRFLFLALGSDYVQEQIRRTWSAGTQPNISMEALERLCIAAPPLQEQIAIAEYLNHRSSEFNELSSVVFKAIDKLREFRSALIAAAVTGKICIRDEFT